MFLEFPFLESGAQSTVVGGMFRGPYSLVVRQLWKDFVHCGPVNEVDVFFRQRFIMRGNSMRTTPPVACLGTIEDVIEGVSVRTCEFLVA